MPERVLKTLLVCGSGRSLFPDLQALGVNSDADLQRFDVLAVNDVILALKDAKHFASYHEEKIESWLMLRECEYHHSKHRPNKRMLKTHSHRPGPLVDKVHTGFEGAGSSSFFAVQVGLAEGYERIILCGVPMDNSGRWYEPPWRVAHDYKVTDGWDCWKKMHAVGKLAKVRSMSGCTRELLGSPPEDWLK